MSKQSFKYPFGMGLLGRKFSASSSNYRYSLNGQEKERELNENITSAEFWMYDSRIGRRWNIDPIVKIWESPYACFSNNPINIIDVKGLGGSKPGKHTVKKKETLSQIAKQYNTTIDVLMNLNKNVKHKDKIREGQVLNTPQFYNPNETDPNTGLKTEILKYIDFSGKKIDLGFKPSETNNFRFGAATSDAEFGPTGGGYQTIAARTNNFFNGTGTTNMVYGPETSFSLGLRNSEATKNARDFFYQKYSKIYTAAHKTGAGGHSAVENINFAESYFVDLARRGQISVTEYIGSWDPIDAVLEGAGNINSIARQYVGSCSINIFASGDANRLIFVVANSTSNWSWKAHLGSNIPRTSEVGGKENSTILNLMVWEESIDYFRL